VSLLGGVEVLVDFKLTEVMEEDLVVQEAGKIAGGRGNGCEGFDKKFAGN
jgi:hypothetical protein